MTAACNDEIYPRYCFHLSTTVNTWCFLPALRIHALQQHAGFEGENFFFYKNLPIKWARVVGSVVAIDDFSGRRVYTLDDSSGRCIEAWALLQSHAQGRPGPALQQASAGPSVAVAVAKDGVSCDPTLSHAHDKVDIGDVLDVKGSLCSFRGEMQIKIEKFAFVRSTSHEIMLWQKRSKFQRDVLNKPWVLEPAVVRRCCKEAEASDPSLKRQKNRHQARKKTTSGKKDPTRPLIADVSESAQARQMKKKKKKKKLADVSLQVKELIQDGSVKGKYGALGL